MSVNEVDGAPKSLYAITGAVKAALDGGFTIDAETGEVYFSPDDVDALNIQLADKAKNVVMYERGRAAMEEAIDAEIRRLQKNKKVVQNQRKRIREYLGDCARLNGGSIETPIGTIRVQRSKASVQVLDEDEIPREYIVEKRSYAPDKRAIYDALSSGEQVPGCALVQGESVVVS